MADRSISFGYNATIAVGLDVLQNLLDAFFDQQNDAHVLTLTDVLTFLTGRSHDEVEGSLHLHVSRPMLGFDVGRRPPEVSREKDVVLRIHTLDGWVFGPKVERDPIGETGASVWAHCTRGSSTSGGSPPTSNGTSLSRRAEPARSDRPSTTCERRTSSFTSRAPAPMCREPR